MVLKVQCDACGARYKLDESRVKGKGARITCPKCGHQFVVYKQDLVDPSGDDDDEPATIIATQDSLYPKEALASRAAEQLADPAPTLAPTPAPAPAPTGPVVTRPSSVNNLNWREVGLTSFKVKVSFGLVYDFGDVATLKRSIADKKVQTTDSVSMDGKSWVLISELGDLDAWFIDRWVALKKAKLEEEAKTSPRMTSFEPDEGPGVAARGPTPRVQPRGDTSRSEDVSDDGIGLTRDLFDGLDDDDPSGSDLGPALAPRTAPKSKAALKVAEQAVLDEAALRPPPRKPEPSMSGAEMAIVGFLALVACGLGWVFASGAMASDLSEVGPAAAEGDPAAFQRSAEGLYPTSLGASKPAAAPAPMPEAPPEAPTAAGEGDAPEAAPAPGAAPAGAPKVEGKKAGKSGALTSNSISASDLEELGDAQMASGNFKAAADSYAKAVAMKPGSGVYQMKLGRAHLAAGTPAKAEQAFKQALKLNPKLVDAHKYLGETYEKLGRSKDAAEAYRRYIQGKPDASDRVEIESRISRLG